MVEVFRTKTQKPWNGQLHLKSLHRFSLVSDDLSSEVTRTDRSKNESRGNATQFITFSLVANSLETNLHYKHATHIKELIQMIEK